ncbi:Octaprenyl diphosphate synthase / Dimethylallyltransferase / (2E,6E)-farnesyl diphosphate synthase / Geranylgeranyl diphosphate synthase [Alloactinosynnema sp. L-07]|uniref:polyprenyl synthetase family protein n=1 Tax=Alloactinosynnema sp. L-07 TaxID=1653480 RepID=UPI00065EF2F4|nr:polyprenyl synthetase family protein [Alloactinosynnema sp. L-07]CRK61979.1 Octaprenyl diphosphate synthase / Dimethylallyltransferase / (2E,6E)-farnesyl diphosphate synthase / Geranylgeranyl diphosphate synthase [Alloactinosynnema sp. L-07]
MSVQVTEGAPSDEARLAGLLAHSQELTALVGEVRSRIAGRWDGDQSLLARTCTHALTPAGKLFRPILLLESALAVGGDPRWVLPAAAGAESGHVASLVHDDIIDDDDIRRGRPAVHAAFGVGDAIVAGDALIFDLFAGLAECHAAGAPADRVVAALAVVSRCGIDLCRGQSLEAEFCASGRFDHDTYLHMVRLKTAALFRAACEGGALLGGGEPRHVLALGHYAQHLGVAFQIRDDLLPYTGSAGKPDTSDVRNGRLTLPVIIAHQAGSPADRAAIEAALSGTDDPATARADLLDVLHRTGAITATTRWARRYLRLALTALQPLPITASLERLRGYAKAAVDRNH